ncbi:MAG: fatty acid oxidation complex subunit alpha FadJ [Gammaproteobacteria bacterium]
MNAPAQVFQVERRADGVAILTLDVPGEIYNVLRADTVAEAEALFTELERDRALTGVVILSGKPGSFIAGADIHMLAACKSADEASALARTGQAFCNRIAAFKAPIVAAIDGICLGGGLELALACQGRVCSDNPKTALGLPEVQLGLLPGSGGTQRLPRLVGVQAALDMMLTGRHLKAQQARRIGLVDEVVPATILLEAALKRVAALRERKPGAPPRVAGGARLSRWALESNPLGLKLLFQQARKRTLAKTYGNYPAPERIIDCVETGLSKGLEVGLISEAHQFGELAMTSQARELMHLYFASNALKKDAGVEGEARPLPVRKLGVLGAGLMGAGIAYVSASRAELPVRLKDQDTNGLNRGLQTMARLVRERLKRRSITAFEASREQRRVTASLDYSGFAGVDLVIEAVFEELTLKRRMVRDIEAHCRAAVIFATNTSSIPIASIAEGAERPERIVGMHYFSPVEKMPLLEVIATPRTLPEVVATAVDLGRRQGKTVIVVKDGAGFYVNRILAPYINDAAHLLEDGVAIDAIDRALERFGFPVGPFTLLDEVGIDVGSKVGPILGDAFGVRLQPTPMAATLLADGRLGKKNRKGFYLYPQNAKGKKIVDGTVYAVLGVTPNRTLSEQAIAERCVLPMLNEAVRCLDEGVIRSPRDGDLGAVFGIGFPPFRGGPFRYADHLGIGALCARLEDYQEQYGERYAPAPLLATMAERGGRFYPQT